MAGAIELASMFDRATGDRLAAAERFLLTLPQLFHGLLMHVDLGLRTSSRFLVVVSHLSSGAYSPADRARLAFWCARAGGVATSITAMNARERNAFLGQLERCDVKLREVAPQALFEAIDRILAEGGAAADRKRAPRPKLALAMDVGGPGWAGVAYDSRLHALFVPGTVAPPVGDEFPVSLRIPGTDKPLEVRSRVGSIRERASPGAPAGFVLLLQSPPPAVEAALASSQAQPEEQKRAAPRYPVKAPVKVSPAAPAAAPAPTTVRIEYATDEELRADYVSNLSQGGAFVRTTSPAPIGTRLTLLIRLPGGVELTAPSTVVFANDGGMGVKFQLEAAADEMLSSFIARISARPRRALVVDDDGLVRKMVSEALEARGFEVLLANDAASGLEIITDEVLTLDVLLTDVHMPGMDGEAFVRTIRQAGGESDLAIVVMTGEVEPEAARRLESLGADAVLEKSLGPDLIAQAADALLERRRAGRGA